jgi:hypothetical protein
MRFMVIRRADKSTETGVKLSKKLFGAMTKYHEDGAKAGIVLDGVGLHPSSKGARVTITAGKPTVTDGPFTETKELIAGFTMIQASRKKRRSRGSRAGRARTATSSSKSASCSSRRMLRLS